LPFRLAVDAKGNPDKFKTPLKRSRYPEFYRPNAPKKVENEQLNLRNLIREALLKSLWAKKEEKETIMDYD
jgi:hypothetical protein